MASEESPGPSGGSGGAGAAAAAEAVPPDASTEDGAGGDVTKAEEVLAETEQSEKLRLTAEKLKLQVRHSPTDCYVVLFFAPISRTEGANAEWNLIPPKFTKYFRRPPRCFIVIFMYTCFFFCRRFEVCSPLSVEVLFAVGIRTSQSISAGDQSHMGG